LTWTFDSRTFVRGGHIISFRGRCRPANPRRAKKKKKTRLPCNKKKTVAWLCPLGYLLAGRARDGLPPSPAHGAVQGGGAAVPGRGNHEPCRTVGVALAGRVVPVFTEACWARARWGGSVCVLVSGLVLLFHRENRVSRPQRTGRAS